MFRVTIAYVAVGLGVIYAADVIFENLPVPGWATTLVVVAVGLGLPLAIALAWAFDVTPEGVVKTPAVGKPPDIAPDTTPKPKAARRALRSLAVLPLTDLSPESDQEYFSDGITEELLNAFVKVPELRVPARTSSFQFKGTKSDVREIARTLGVEAVVEGSVRTWGDEVVITAQLVDAADGYHLWSETYERKRTDVLALQREIAQAIVAALRVELVGAERLHQISPDTDPEAYTLYLKARFFWNKRTEDGLRRAVELFERSLEREPAFAVALAGLADTYGLLSDHNYLPALEAMPRAKEAAERALSIDDSLAEAHTSLAMILHDFDWDYEQSEAEYLRALELNPSYATAHHWYGEFLTLMARFAEGIRHLERALALDPLSLAVHADLGAALYLAGRTDDAITRLETCLELDPTFARAHRLLGLTHLRRGDLGSATAALREAALRSHDAPDVVAALAHVAVACGDRSEAERLVERLESRAGGRFVSPYELAVGYVALGANDSAIDQLQEAKRQRVFQIVHLKVDPLMDGLRDDRRFARVLAEIGLA